MNTRTPPPSELHTLQEGIFPILRRPRRNRSSPAWRGLVTETHLNPSQLVYPVFLTEGPCAAIISMPGIFRLPVDDLFEEIEEALSLGIQAINLFCHIDDHKKDAIGSEAYCTNGLLPTAIREIKKRFPELLVIADIALDPFTSHGLDGLINENMYVVNDPTLVALGHMALRAAEAGVDMISPSDMMDGRVAYLRRFLDSHGFSQVGILSYAVKFASSLYAPFREALESTPRGGDKKTFQVNPANVREALLECAIDDQEAADMLLIKPAITSLDVISKVRAQTLLPIGAYQVSGEYAMIKAAASNGWINGEEVLMEALIAIRRAGADFIFTYAAKEAARLLKKKGF
jgi:porphobilinogen synthase